MIKIFNNNGGNLILIDDSLDWIAITPMLYLENPFIKIEMQDFCFGNHAMNCIDCLSFIDSFGKKSDDWFLEYNSKKYLLDMETVGSKKFGANELKQMKSEFFNGTILTLSLIEIDKNILKALELESAMLEDYYSACRFRDLIKKL
jgi:hypothetical protein